MDFSSLHRSDILSRLSSGKFDLLVIGGGITGAGIALDAASRGLKVALIEKTDFAFGTSSRSTKLIHGGLRYLKQLEFGLVKEVGSERAIVHALAPHLVVPEKMLLPLHEKRGMGYWLTSLGLMIYDFLAGVKAEDRRRMLTRKQTLKAEPLLQTDDIKGGALYAEYRTDDARLTIEICKTAVRYGALLINHVAAEKFVYDADNTVKAVSVRDLEEGNNFIISSTVVVNAAGPWVDELRELDGSKRGKHLHLTKGVHLVTEHKKFPVKQAIYFDVEDGRMIFAIPRGKTTYIGTTDTDYVHNKNKVNIDDTDIKYLVDAVNRMFPSVRLEKNDIKSGWAGLRPLIYEEGKSASELSRKDEIFESAGGLISIAGGKLTGYRKMAERVVNLVIKKYYDDRGLKPCFTNQIPLTSSGWRNTVEVRQYIINVSKRLTTMALPATSAPTLVELYGRQLDVVLDEAQRLVGEHDVNTALILAQLKFSIQFEMINTLTDFFVRRTGMLYFQIENVLEFAPTVAGYMGKIMGWSPGRIREELDALDEVLREVKPHD